jgi:hypothetical protein
MLVYKRYFKLTLAVCCGFLGSTTAVAVETLNTNKLQRSCVEYITSEPEPLVGVLKSTH